MSQLSVSNSRTTTSLECRSGCNATFAVVEGVSERVVDPGLVGRIIGKGCLGEKLERFREFPGSIEHAPAAAAVLRIAEIQSGRIVCSECGQQFTSLPNDATNIPTPAIVND